MTEQTPQRPRRRVGRPSLRGPNSDRSPLSELTDEERRTLFLQTAALLFERKGYASTSVEDIASELGFTKGVFYYYWTNKREIVQEIHDRALQILEQRLAAVGTDRMSPAQRLEAAIDRHVEAVLQHRSIIAVLLGNVELSQDTLERRQRYADHFQRLIQEGIAAGAVRDIDPQILTFLVLGLCNSLARWYRPDGRLSEATIRELCSAFAAHGWVAAPATPAQGVD